MQKHISNARVESSDYEMFIPSNIQSNEIGVYKIIKTEVQKNIFEDENQTEKSGLSLSVVGFS